MFFKLLFIVYLYKYMIWMIGAIQAPKGLFTLQVSTYMTKQLYNIWDLFVTTLEYGRQAGRLAGRWNATKFRNI